MLRKELTERSIHNRKNGCVLQQKEINFRLHNPATIAGLFYFNSSSKEIGMPSSFLSPPKRNPQAKTPRK